MLARQQAEERARQAEEERLRSVCKRVCICTKHTQSIFVITGKSERKKSAKKLKRLVLRLLD